MKGNDKFGLVLLLTLGFCLGANAHAQRKQLRPRADRPPAVQPKPKPQERNMLGMPAGWVERLQTMTPKQQERFFSNNARFRSLPPERQEQVRRRLQVWNNLTPEQRQALVNRQQVWAEMTPDQQRYVRETLLPAWQNMPPVRRQVVLKKLRDLRGLDDAQRTAKLNDETFLGGLDPGERNMLRDLSNLRVGSPEGGDEAVP
jgi:hypothetical protein